MKKKELILRLLMDDLVHRKLITGLYQLNIDASAYSLYLSETIFKLMGYSKKEITVELYDRYAELTAPVHKLDLSELNVKLRELAKVVYGELGR